MTMMKYKTKFKHTALFFFTPNDSLFHRFYHFFFSLYFLSKKKIIEMQNFNKIEIEMLSLNKRRKKINFM
jgi:hypothetical protein